MSSQRGPTFFAGSPKNYMVAADDADRLLLRKKMKKDFDYMTSSVLMEHQKHLLAAIHFKAIYNHLLYIPSIGITLISGILAVLVQSDLLQQNADKVCTVWIAILATVSVFWQSLMKQLDYGGRAMLHDSTAQALTKIYKLAVMRSREQQISDLGKVKSRSGSGELKEAAQAAAAAELQDHDEESAVPNPLTVATTEDGGSNAEEASARGSPEVHVTDGEDHFTLSKQFEQALQGCTSVVPVRISAAFNALESRINVYNKRLIPSTTPKPKIAWEKVYPALYDQMTLTIIGSKLWPWVSPDADWAVKKTIEDFGKADANVLEVLVDRGKQIDVQYSNMPTAMTPLLTRTTV